MEITTRVSVITGFDWCWVLLDVASLSVSQLFSWWTLALGPEDEQTNGEVQPVEKHGRQLHTDKQSCFGNPDGKEKPQAAFR